MPRARAVLVAVHVALAAIAACDTGALRDASADGDDDAGDDDDRAPDDADAPAADDDDEDDHEGDGVDAGAEQGDAGGDDDEPPPVVGACTPGAVAGCTDDGDGDFTCTLEHDGRARTYLLRVPADPPAAPALVVDLHGLNTTASVQRYVSSFHDQADPRGLVVVHPEGTGTSWNAGFCCGSAYSDDVDDTGFLVAVVERLREDLCVDPRRVYATGLSNGGHMAYRLACERADLFAAIASVAGLEVTTSCAPARPVPILQVHGTADGIVSYDDGIDGATGAEDVVAAWAERNGCADTTTTTYDEGDATCVAHDGCDAAAELCTIDGGGHQWPGGGSLPFLGHTSTDLDATSRIADFFAAHALP